MLGAGVRLQWNKYIEMLFVSPGFLFNIFVFLQKALLILQMGGAGELPLVPKCTVAQNK